MQFVLFRVFGYIPSPIIFGNVIDSTCLLWNAFCGVQGGSCLIYNIENFRLRYCFLSFISFQQVTWDSNVTFKRKLHFLKLRLPTNRLINCFLFLLIMKSLSDKFFKKKETTCRLQRLGRDRERRNFNLMSR